MKTITLQTVEIFSKQQLEEEAKKHHARVANETELLPDHWTIVSITAEEQEEFQTDWDYLFVYRSKSSKIRRHDLYAMVEADQDNPRVINYQLVVEE